MGKLTREADREIHVFERPSSRTSLALIDRTLRLEEALKWALERIEPQTAAIDQINEIKYKGLIDE